MGVCPCWIKKKKGGANIILAWQSANNYNYNKRAEIHRGIVGYTQLANCFLIIIMIYIYINWLSASRPITFEPGEPDLFKHEFSFRNRSWNFYIRATSGLHLFTPFIGIMTKPISNIRNDSPGRECFNQDSHLDDGSGVSDLSAVSDGKRVISELQVKLLEVDLDHLSGQGINMSGKDFPLTFHFVPDGLHVWFPTFSH